MDEELTLQFDGGSRGNPGPAGIGVVVQAKDGTPLVTLGRFIGRATNNVAEYRALITAMEEAGRLGARRVVIRGDSELVVRQMLGVYKVRHLAMKPLYEEAQRLMRTFEKARIEHNLRNKNELADKLANMAMDRRADVTDPDGNPGQPSPKDRGGGGGSIPSTPRAPSLSPSTVVSRASQASAEPRATNALGPSAGVGAGRGPTAPEPTEARFFCSDCGCLIEVKKFGRAQNRDESFICQCGSPMSRGT